MTHTQHRRTMQHKLKLLMWLSVCVGLLSLSLLFWNSRSEGKFQLGIVYLPTNSADSVRTSSLEGEGWSKELKVSFTPVKGTKTLLISAFLEHRGKNKQVRVLAVALRSESPSYVCLLCCEQELVLSRGSAELHSDHFDFPYGTADILCVLPPRCSAPTRVAVTSEGVSQVGDCSGKLTEGFLEVQNREERVDSFPNKFVVCISTMFDFSNVLQFVQTVEMMKILGVNRVVVYKSSCSSDVQRLLDYYTHKGLVEVIPWTLTHFLNVSRGWLPLHGPGDIHYFGQIPALNDCLYRYMYRTEWLALQDLDELILPQTVDSWSKLMPLLENKYGTKRCYMFENNVFPINVQPPPSTPPLAKAVLHLRTHWTNVSGVDILQHLHQEPIIPETHYSNFKIITNPRAITSPTVHGVLNPPGICSWIDRKVARLYHTRDAKQPQLTSEQLIFDGRLLSFISRLVPSVDAVLRDQTLHHNGTA